MPTPDFSDGTLAPAIRAAYQSGQTIEEVVATFGLSSVAFAQAILLTQSDLGLGLTGDRYAALLAGN